MIHPNSAPFLVMELLIGQTLDAMLGFQTEGLSEREVLPLIDQRRGGYERGRVSPK